MEKSKEGRKNWFPNKNEVEWIKDFTLWAKKQKIAQFAIGEIQVVFTPQAFIEGDAPELADEEAVEIETDLNDVDDDLLYHSS